MRFDSNRCSTFFDDSLCKQTNGPSRCRFTRSCFYIFAQITHDDRVHLVEAIAHRPASKVIIMLESTVVSRICTYLWSNRHGIRSENEIHCTGGALILGVDNGQINCHSDYSGCPTAHKYTSIILPTYKIRY